MEVLREEGLEAVRYSLWDMTGWHAEYDPCIWRDRAADEQKRIGWGMRVRMDRIMCAVLREAHERQIEVTVGALSEGPEGFFGSCLDGT